MVVAVPVVTGVVRVVRGEVAAVVVPATEVAPEAAGVDPVAEVAPELAVRQLVLGPLSMVKAAEEAVTPVLSLRVKPMEVPAAMLTVQVREVP
jgi:hypothetical protein